MYYAVYYGIAMTVITVRLPREVKRRLERRRVNVSETVRALLEQYVRQLELGDLAAKLDMLMERVGPKIDPELIARLVREDREAR